MNNIIKDFIEKITDPHKGMSIDNAIFNRNATILNPSVLDKIINNESLDGISKNTPVLEVHNFNNTNNQVLTLQHIETLSIISEKCDKYNFDEYRFKDNEKETEITFIPF